LFTAKSSETITQRVFNEDEDSEDDEENDPDYDSDVLSDSEESDSDSDNYENEDEEEEGEESAEDDEGNVWENDEAYVNFLNALLSDDVILEDDDEEYKPDDAKEEDETLDADEIYHEGTGRLAKHELIELVDGCLQTIAGEAPVVPAGVETTGNIALTEGGNATRSPGSTHNPAVEPVSPNRLHHQKHSARCSSPTPPGLLTMNGDRDLRCP
jgi:hypothetical protein